MEMSESINELATALAKAQGVMEAAEKDKINPHFQSHYSSLDALFAAGRKPLSDQGLAVVQCLDADGQVVQVTTLLLHSSGQWIRQRLMLVAKDDSPQAIGSASTYGKRYGYAAMVGMTSDEDDDGEAAQPRGAKPVVAALPMPPKYEAWVGQLNATVSAGTAALQQFWKQSSPDHRTYLLRTAPKSWEAMKAAAAKVSPAVPA